jgi:hypothetical protein
MWIQKGNDEFVDLDDILGIDAVQVQSNGKELHRIKFYHGDQGDYLYWDYHTQAEMDNAVSQIKYLLKPIAIDETKPPIIL